ncbi:MAG TPA: isoprenylcysteine carboxylmethyltransferase family protein [Longimicrobiales bacterium]|nr:isoprenylcysteine carboxylmethyltransferase family protein [Longimicrobiales bacterium]
MFRWWILGILVAAIGSSGFYRWRARIEGGTISRREEGPFLVALRLLVTVPLLGAILAYLINPAWMSWSELRLPSWLRWTGIALGVLAIASVHWVLRSLGKNVSETVLTKPGHQLVTHGPYRWVRHPLYTTGLTLLIAVGLTAANAVLLALAGLGTVFFHLVIIPREEAALQDRFGDAYRDYMQRTGRLLPRLRKRSAGATRSAAP